MLCDQEVQTQVTMLGLLLAAISAILNGTFPMCGKLCKEAPDPIIFNSMLCIGVLISSVLAIPFILGFLECGSGCSPLGWTWMGALAGVLLVFATLLSFIAIPLAGLATAAATWSCAAVVTSFFWGAVGPPGIGKSMANVPLCIAAVVTLVAGALVINFSSQIVVKIFGSPGSQSWPEAHDATANEDPEDTSSVQLSESDNSKNANTNAEPGQPRNKVLGLLIAVLNGFFGGSILVPAAYVEKELQGLPLLPSFGVGCGVAGTLVGLVYVVFFRKDSCPPKALAKEFRCEVVVFGILAGFLWNIGNIAQVIAMTNLHMPYGVSYPILQCGLLFAGIWGIYFFKEVSDGKTILTFWLGAVILIGGVVVLGLNGPGTGPQEPQISCMHHVNMTNATMNVSQNFSVSPVSEVLNMTFA
eukprot:gnl/MRDRNA2_/MRDRNA2_32284_c0_seq1.p1 gnl/MRDRNA2_/MRDRNA2_32284_c0~~gnl/MRDRNA2_/MRDRNA2_32284_c0_seq1.p1  ORF type:complete len:415 (+),score=31.80 gnl/MRDRNA2_/MRDRNA2_32284_c0_seq1:68-1312(+)